MVLEIYKGMILLYFDHGDIVYIGTKEKLLNKLQVKQNRALKICLKVDQLHPTQDKHQSDTTNKQKDNSSKIVSALKQ